MANTNTKRDDARLYCAVEPDRRYGNAGYDFELFKDFPTGSFSSDELEALESSIVKYHERKHALSETLHKKELERFIIELSWKSSRIEGNTYTLLDYELNSIEPFKKIFVEQYRFAAENYAV